MYLYMSYDCFKQIYCLTKQVYNLLTIFRNDLLFDLKGAYTLSFHKKNKIVSFSTYKHIQSK